MGDDGDLDRQAAYTALSRGRVENRLYMLTPDEDLQALLDPNPTQLRREPLLTHVEHELSRDRSQHLARDLLANLADPDPGITDDFLHQSPEPIDPGAHSTMADELLAQLPGPVGPEPDVAEQVAKVTAHLDRLQEPPDVSDDLGIGL